MRRWILISVFLIGLGIFSYPIIANMVSTTAHQRVINDYSETVSQLSEEEIKSEREKAREHNEKLKDSQLEFVDPYAEDADEQEDQREGNKSYYDALNIGPSIGTLQIPSIRVHLPVYHGTSSKVLSRGVGHMENSSLPTGEPGTHSVLTAHRGLPSSKLFRHLDDVEIGDTFFLDVLDEKYAYEVFDIDIVLPHQTEWLQLNDDEEIVTLLTCDPYMINTHRMLVKGKRVPYDPDAQDIPLPEDDHNNYFYIAIGVGILLVLLLFFLYRRRKRAREEHEEV